MKKREPKPAHAPIQKRPLNIMTALFQISVTTEPTAIETLSDIFMEFGASAITMTDAKDEPLFQLSPEEKPLWQHTTLHAIFDSNYSADIIIEEIKKNFPEFEPLNFYAEKIENQNWVEITQKQFHAQQFGKLWICPQWEKTQWLKDHKREKQVVFIEPGLAFGTGTHPTTQLCLTWLANHPLQNQTVIDYGCGSGILALAACAMGAKIVWATDHDHQALISTKNNASYNAFSTDLHCVTTENIQPVQAEIVVANILANTLIDLAPTLTPLVAENGKLILSGVLSEDTDRVIAAYEDNFTKIDVQTLQEWVLIELTKK